MSISDATRFLTTNFPLNWQKKEILSEDDDLAAVYLSWMDDFTPVTIEFILDLIQGCVNCKVDLSIGAEQLSQIGTPESCVAFCKDQMQQVANRMLQIAEPSVLFLDRKVEYKDLQPLETNGEVTFLISPDYDTVEFDLLKICNQYVEGAVPVRLKPWNKPKLMMTVRAQD